MESVKGLLSYIEKSPYKTNILAIDIMNEPEQRGTADMREFLKVLAPVVRDNTSCPVTLGVTVRNLNALTIFMADIGKYIALVQIHQYPDFPLLPSAAELRKNIPALGSLPIIIGEYGYDNSLLKKSVTAVVDEVKTQGYAGIIFWQGNWGSSKVGVTDSEYKKAMSPTTKSEITIPEKVTTRASASGTQSKAKAVSDEELENLDLRFDNLLRAFQARIPKGRINIIKEAYKIARDNFGTKRFDPSQELYLAHTLSVAETAERWGADDYTIAAALLHKLRMDTMENVFSRNKMRREDAIRPQEMIRNLAKTSRIIHETIRGSWTLQNYMDMQMVLTGTPQNMQLLLDDKLYSIPEAATRNERKYRFAEIENIYATQAERLGLLEASNELRNLGFKFTEDGEERNQYKMSLARVISEVGIIEMKEAMRMSVEELEAKYGDAQGELEKIRDSLASFLASRGLQASIRFRVKSPYSYWKKALRSADPITDPFGIMVISDDKRMSLLIEEWYRGSGIFIVDEANTTFRNIGNDGYEARWSKLLCERIGGAHTYFRLSLIMMDTKNYSKYTFGIMPQKVLNEIVSDQKVDRPKEPRPHWAYKDLIKHRKPEQRFRSDPPLTGDYEQDFETILKAIQSRNTIFVGFVIAERAGLFGKKLRIKEMQIVELPKGAIAADLAAHPEINRLNKQYKGLYAVDLVKHAELAVNVETAAKEPLAEDTPLRTGQFFKLATDRELVFTAEKARQSARIIRANAKEPRTLVALNEIVGEDGRMVRTSASGMRQTPEKAEVVIGIPKGALSGVARTQLEGLIRDVFPKDVAKIYDMQATSPDELSTAMSREGVEYGIVLNLSGDRIALTDVLIALRNLEDKRFAGIVTIDNDNIGSKSEQEWSKIMQAIKENLPEISPTTLERIEARTQEISESFKHTPSPQLNTFIYRREKAVSVTTQGILESQMIYALRDKIRNRWQTMGIQNRKADPIREIVAITDPNMSEEFAKKYIDVLGLTKYVELRMARTHDEKTALYTELSMLKAGGIAHVGIRSRENDKIDYSALKDIVALELGAINGEFVDTNSYELLFELFAIKDQWNEWKQLPGISKDETRKVFIYIPKTVPFNYEKEIRQHQEALKTFLQSA